MDELIKSKIRNWYANQYTLIVRFPRKEGESLSDAENIILIHTFVRCDDAEEVARGPGMNQNWIKPGENGWNSRAEAAKGPASPAGD